MPYRPIQIANELIRRFGPTGQIDPMKLQKLLYFANGWHLGVRGSDLLSERPQVWRYGPVFRSAYRTFSRYGRQSIVEPEPSTPFGGPPEFVQDADQMLESFLSWIWQEYGHMDGPSLSDETHKVGTPWQIIAQQSGYAVPEYTEIPRDLDWRYFSELARQRGYQTAPYNPA